MIEYIVSNRITPVSYDQYMDVALGLKRGFDELKKGAYLDRVNVGLECADFDNVVIETNLDEFTEKRWDESSLIQLIFSTCGTDVVQLMHSKASDRDLVIREYMLISELEDKMLSKVRDEVSVINLLGIKLPRRTSRVEY